MTPEQRQKMEDHEAMSQFGFPVSGPHPEMHCDIHRYGCCICDKDVNDIHIKEEEEVVGTPDIPVQQDGAAS